MSDGFDDIKLLDIIDKNLESKNNKNYNISLDNEVKKNEERL